MKEIILIFSLLLMSFTCKGQNRKPRDIVNYNELTINGVNFLGNNVNLVTEHFGQPNSIEDYYFEMDKVMSKKYSYKGILFTIINNSVYSFEITGSGYNFTKNNINIKDNIESIEAIYPLSFTNRSNTGLILSLNDMDQFVVIAYSNNNLIDKIAMYSY